MHECNGFAKFRSCMPSARAVCLSSQSAPFNINSTRRKCGTDEGQMRERIGYLVACRGAEQTAVRTAVGIPQRYPCGEGRAYRVHAYFDDASIGADTAVAGIRFAGIALDGIDVSESVSAECAPTDSSRTGTPISIIYGREKSADEATAGALAGFGMFD